MKRPAIGLPQLRWVAIVLPAGFVLAFEIGRLVFLEPGIPLFSTHLIAASVLVGSIVAFGFVFFRLLEKQAQTVLLQARQAHALQQIGAEVSALLEPDRLIPLVVGRARDLLAADAAGLARFDAAGGVVHWHHFVAKDGGSADFRAIRLRPGEGVVGHVVVTGRPLAVADLLAGLPPGVESAPILEREGFRSALAVPLRTGEQVLGALMVANRGPRAFRVEETTLLTSLANQVAIALTNAELYAQAQLGAERLERLIESSGDAIITTDLQGRTLSWNRGAEAIYGWSREEAIGTVLPMVPPDLLDNAKAIMGDLIASGEVLANYETERRRKDGGRIAVVVTASPIRNAAGDLVGFLGISKDLSAHRQVEEQERRLALLEDRERIGMELHDGAIQSLYAVGLGLEAAAQVLETDPPLARARLERARDSVDSVIQEIRNYILGLRRDAFWTQGLRAGLTGLVQELEANTLVDVELDIAQDTERIFVAERAQELFQIAREALANIARHAEATRASLSLVPTADGWLLRVWDNGVGFDAAAASSGFGLGNMRERARRLGGDLAVISRPGEGTEVRLTLQADGRRGP